MVVVIAVLSLAGLSLIKVGDASADSAATVLGSDLTKTTDAEVALSSVGPIAVKPDSGVYTAMGKMLGALGVVILLAYVALYALRRLMGKRYGGGGKSSLEVLQTTHVGQHKTISLVRVGQRSVLVGVTEQNISTLTELDVQETEEIIGAATVPETKDGFASLLTAATDRLKIVGLKRKSAVLETS
ncbi:MAG: flagellar biosynthetic protein FliO [candidate division Zixibacteria bacterium]|nr:flagellar biosynthetic protein FliO [candidate division Zixibacteria bacterium]